MDEFNKKLGKVIISIDAETDGLLGPAFAIGAVVRDAGQDVNKFCGRAHHKVETPWVRENVLPALASEPVTHKSSPDLEDDFWVWLIDNLSVSRSAIIVGYCVHPVETGLLVRCANRNVQERAFALPCPAIHDVATAMLLGGHGLRRLSSFVREAGLTLPAGNPHHPLYDATLAAMAWELLVC